MEKLKAKHDHKLTDIIKIGIFALFLILPILMFLPSCLYYGFNEHAIQETEITTGGYEVTTKYETNEVNSVNDIVNGNIYNINIDNQTIDELMSSNGSLDLIIINLNSYDFSSYSIDLSEFIYSSSDIAPVIPFLEFYIDSEFNGYFYLYPYAEEMLFNLEIGVMDEYTFSLNAEVVIWDIDALIDYSIFSASDYKVYDVNYTEEKIEKLNITQAIEYNWQELWKAPVLSWTGNNNFQFTIKAFTSVFGITQESYIANYITYLMTLLVIYIVFDIVIMVFTKLTHLFSE